MLCKALTIFFFGDYFQQLLSKTSGTVKNDFIVDGKNVCVMNENLTHRTHLMKHAIQKRVQKGRNNWSGIYSSKLPVFITRNNKRDYCWRICFSIANWTEDNNYVFNVNYNISARCIIGYLQISVWRNWIFISPRIFANL